MNKPRTHLLSFAFVSFATVATVGCGGQLGSTGGGSFGSIGSVSFNIVGAAQNPVNRTSGTIAISGIAGATFSNIRASDSQTQPLLFTSDEDGQETIMGMTSTSALRTYLIDTISPGLMAEPCAFPDGTRFAFSIFNGVRWQLSSASYGYTFSYSSLGSPSSSNDQQPFIAPSGTSVYFTSDSDGNKEIWRLDTLLNTKTQLTFTGAGVSNQNPTISSDGNWLAFQSDRDGNNEIYVRNLSDGVDRRITNNAGDDVEPAFSPNDLHIVFSSNRSGNYNIYRALLRNGSLVTQLTTDTNSDREPTFSPDGSKIFFTSDRDDQVAPVSTEIYSMASNGTAQTRISVDSSFNQKSPMVMPTVSPLLSNLGFNTTGAGVIVSQNSSAVVSILSFDISSPSDANRGLTRAISETLPGTGVPLIYYTVTTPTSLTSLQYTKPSLKLFPTVVSLSPANPATDALITYSAAGTNAGQVTSVFFYSANRSSMKKRQEGQYVVFEGNFTDAFGADGKRLQSGTGSVAKFDLNGNLVSYQ